MITAVNGYALNLKRCDPSSPNLNTLKHCFKDPKDLPQGTRMKLLSPQFTLGIQRALKFRDNLSPCSLFNDFHSLHGDCGAVLLWPIS